VGKWEILGIVDEGVNSKTRILLQFWDFHRLNVDDAWSLLVRVVWDSFEFEKACYVYGYSFPDQCAFYARSYYAPVWCDLCNKSAHNVSSYPYYACYAHFDSSVPLTRYTRLEVGEHFGLDASFGMNNKCCGFEDTLDREHNLVDTPLEGCREVFVHNGSPSLTYDNVTPNPLEHSHVSTFCSQPSLSSPELDLDVPNDISTICDFNVDMCHDNNMFKMLGGNNEKFESLGYFSGYDAALDSYCIDLVDKLRKIMWNTFFDFCFDFSMVFTFIKRALIYFALILCMLSYCKA